MEPLGAAAAAARIASGDLAPSELTERCAARIAERDDVVRAWVDWDPAPATQAAAARDRETPAGPLHGVPVGIKDIIDTADLPTQHGSPIFAGHRPETDAACVAILRAAGAIVLGKTATTEFAAYEPTVTTNPHDAGRTPGGSSSGSAAAVADGMVPLALGTQTAGSVVRPAAFCGVFGFKATYGRADRRGIGAQAPSLDTLGWFARHADDLALALDLLAPPAEAETGGRPEHPRVAVVRTDHWEEADADARTALETAASRLADAGAEVEELDPPEPFPGLTDAQTTIQAFEAAETLGPLRELHEGDLSDKLRALLDTGAAIRPEDHVAAIALGEDARSRATELFERYDVLLTPAARGVAPRGLDATGDPLFCRAWTLLGTPVLAVPGLHNAEGMPVGVQLVGSPGGDRALIDLGGRLHALLA